MAEKAFNMNNFPLATRLTRLADHALIAVNRHKRLCLDCQKGKPCKRSVGLENTLSEYQKQYQEIYESNKAKK